MNDLNPIVPAPTRLSIKVAAGAVLVMFLWAICFPLISVGLAASPPMTFAALRAVISGVALLVVAQALGRPVITGKTLWGGVVLVGLTATSLGFFGMFYGGARVSPGLATVIANTQPLIAAVLAWGFLDERLRPLQQLGLAVGFGGIVLIGAPGLSGSQSQTMGMILIVIGAIGIAVSNVALKRMAGRVDPLWAMGWQLVIGAVPLGLIALAIENPTTVEWSVSFTLSLITLSIAGTAAAFCLWFSLLQRASLSQLNVYTFLTPIFGLAMGSLFFAEQLHGLAIAGVALSLLGIYWVSRPTKMVKGVAELVRVEAKHGD